MSIKFPLERKGASILIELKTYLVGELDPETKGYPCLVEESTQRKDQNTSR